MYVVQGYDYEGCVALDKCRHFGDKGEAEQFAQELSLDEKPKGSFMKFQGVVVFKATLKTFKEVSLWRDGEKS